MAPPYIWLDQPKHTSFLLTSYAQEVPFNDYQSHWLTKRWGMWHKFFRELKDIAKCKVQNEKFNRLSARGDRP
jgi:hypothetical protein